MKAGFLVVASHPESLLNFRGELLDSIKSRGFDVHVAAPDIVPGSVLQCELAGRGFITHSIPLQRTGMNPVADLSAVIALYRLMREIRPAAMLAYTIKPVIYGGLAGWLAGIPRRFALITGLGYAFSDALVSARQRLLQSLVKKLYALALQRSSRVFFQNSDDQGLFQQLGLLGKTASQVVNGSGVSLQHFSCAPLPDAPVFLLIARLLGSKGVREYAAAAREIRKKSPTARFLLAGWIDSNPDAIQESELQSWIAEGVIEYLGHLQDVRPAIGQCSVYVLPSYREGTPRTVLEAMSMGRAVITTDAPGCRETVVNGVNGFLVPVKSVDLLVDAMQTLIESQQLRRDMGESSRRIAEEKYDVHRVNAAMLEGMGIR